MAADFEASSEGRGRPGWLALPRRVRPVLAAVVLGVAAFAGLGARGAYQALSAAPDCCYPGSPCCHPGAPCCEARKHAGK